MSTALLPTAERRSVGQALPAGDAAPLDAVHDHVLRLLGDAETAAAVVTDVALRAGSRARDGGRRPTLTDLLRSAHARMAVEERTSPSAALVRQLAADADPTASVLVTAMATPGRAGAAVLDLTARHGLDLGEAADVVGLDRSAAAATRTEALRQVRAHLTDAGVGLGLDVSVALARLPVVPAAAELHGLLDTTAAGANGSTVPAPVAWLGTAVVALATIGALVVALPALTDGSSGDTPVVTAEQVADGPAARQLSRPGDDAATDVERLVVQRPQPAQPSTQSEPEQSTPAPEPSPEPTPPPSPEPQPEDDDGTSDDPQGPEPSPAPSNPLDLDLLDP